VAAIAEKLRFVEKLIDQYRIYDREHFVKYIQHILETTRPRIRDAEALTSEILAKIVRKPMIIRGGYRLVEALTLLLQTDASRIFFPSKSHVTVISNALGVELSNSFPPEVILPFSVDSHVRVRYNPYDHVIESRNVYDELKEIYLRRPRAVFIVSKFIDWKGFYRFAELLREVEKTGDLPRTYIVSSDPILPELQRRYNIVRLKSKSHVKIFAVIWRNSRFCYLGSMNILSPSKHDDFLLMTKFERYCMEYLLRAMLL
jgi:glycosyltransferase involved in cell wall biosynthesis